MTTSHLNSNITMWWVEKDQIITNKTKFAFKQGKNFHEIYQSKTSDCIKNSVSVIPGKSK